MKLIQQSIQNRTTLMTHMYRMVLIGTGCLFLAMCSSQSSPATETVALNGAGQSQATTAPAVGFTVRPTPGSSTSEAVEPAPVATGKELGAVATVTRWSSINIPLNGPDSVGLSAEFNPFSIPVTVTFTGPAGQTYAVPAFYDGDGTGDLNGNRWSVRFTPDTDGVWSFQTTSTVPSLADYTGSLTVTPPANCPPADPAGLPVFRCVGRLQHVGMYYLKFADGPFWLKGGADEPEDFLAPGRTVGLPSKVAALDFLAERNINSIYVMPHNIDGDGKNVWPWVGSNPAEAKRDTTRFDNAKLAEWEVFFSAAQERGIVIQIVLEDDSGWTDFDRSLYYREMVARFAHHNGIYWNISEEFNENYSPEEIKAFAAQLRALDPYDHPITVHPTDNPQLWEPFIGDPNIDLTSLQTKKEPQNETAIAWRTRVAEGGRIIPISFDEIGQPRVEDRALARHIAWSVYLGGGNYELFTTLDDEGYPAYAAHFADLGLARATVARLPFWDMQPRNDLIQSGTGYLFAQTGSAYLAYLPQGGSLTLDLVADTATYAARWLNPRDGTSQPLAEIPGGAPRSVSAPDSQDWVLILEAQSG